MALSPISTGLPATLRPNTPARSDAAIAAQRAFFQAALAQTQAVEPVRPSPSTPPRPATRAMPSAPTSDEPPERILRPGSLLDIKV